LGSRIGGGLLILLALFMLVGFLNADVARSAGTTLLALLITVALPAGAGIALLRKGAGGQKRLAERRDVLRQQTLTSELLRFAGQRGGKLTAVEVVSEFAVTPDEAERALRDLVVRGLAEPEVTKSGLLVYAFHDVRLLEEKPRSKGILE
jgi:hypothetical protein